MLEKRDRSPYWQVRFTLRGVSVNRSSGTTDRKKAEALEEKLRREIWDAKEGAGASITWEEGVALWESEKRSKRSIKRDRQILALAGEMKWSGKLLSEITEEDIAEYGRALRAATSTGNAIRHLAMLRSYFNAMYRWKKIRLPVRVELPEGEKFEPVTSNPLDIGKLMLYLPGHMRSLVTFAVETGLRFSNVAKLRWEAVRGGAYLDLDNRTVTIPPPSAKSKKPLTIPLSERAFDVVRDMERSKTGYVFTDHLGRAPFKSVKTSWKRATTKAGLVGLRFHDLRHAWASAHARAGTPSRVLQDLGGWASEAMLRRYTHLNVADLRRYVK